MAISIYLENALNHSLGKWVSLPCSSAVLETVLDEIDANASYEYIILETICKVEGISACVNKHTSLAELNEAAFLLQQLSSSKLNKVMVFISDKTPNMTSLLLYLQSLSI